jgi:uncharacterized protein (TIGR02391 family)
MPDLFGRDLDELMRLPVDDFALAMLPDLLASYGGVGGTLCWNNVRIEYRSRLDRQGVDELTIQAVLAPAAAAWQWLRNETLLAPHPTQSAESGWETLTALTASAQAGTLADARTLRSLRRAELHPALRERVVPIFAQGLYAAAVFQAMLEVEVRVREATGLELDGVPLMKDAFRFGGRLADPAQPKGDQEAEMALFWGAIGVFRNTAGHNRTLPGGDPQEAAEAVFLANALLRIVERRLARSA